MLGLYIHIPYCRTICPYCDFVRRPLPDGSVPNFFVEALCAEIDAFEGPRTAQSVFFGGGTPSLLAPASLERILASLHRRFTFPADAEFTVEANPDDVEPDLADAWGALGINRVSLGVQSFDDDALRYLGRRHDADRARRACGIVGDRFTNWSLDLIFGAPPVNAWDSTLRSAIGMGSTHISAYGLTYEEGTPFGKRRQEAVEDDLSLELFRRAHDLLSEFLHYEISNYAKSGFECRHNLVYWHNDEYAGFGPAAYSYLNRTRSRNRIKTDEYLAAPGEKVETLFLTDREVKVETLLQHFRLRNGLPKQEYLLRFGKPVRAEFGEVLDRLLERGLLAEDEEAIRPTPMGFELNNEIGLAIV